MKLLAYRGLTSLLAFGFVLMGSSSNLGAQVLNGILVDDATDLSVDGASMTLFTLGGERLGSVVTDDEGRFVIEVPELGDYRLEAQRLGYRTTRSQRFRVTGTEALKLTFYVATDAVLLEPLVVRVPQVSGRDLFKGREAGETGVLFDPDEVEALRPVNHAGEILEHVDDLRLRWRWGRLENGSSGPVPIVSTYTGDGCVNYIVDRTPVEDAWFGGVTDWGVSPLAELAPEDLVAVEVYRHANDLPADYVRQLSIDGADQRRKLRDIQRSTCGVVIFWTQEAW